MRHKRKRVKTCAPCRARGAVLRLMLAGQDANHRVTVVPVWFGAVTRANAARAVVCAGRDGAARGHNLSQS